MTRSQSNKKNKIHHVHTKIKFNMSYKNEEGYLQLLNSIIHDGIENKNDRTGVGTQSRFGEVCKYDISDWKLPLLTTKKVNFLSIVRELLFFISGSPDTNALKEQGVRIWEYYTSREMLDKCDLKDYPVGSYGPLYGVQWRHSGAKYVPNKPIVGGVDQLSELINGIKANPESRRHVICSWNPSDLKKSPLPPCHVLFQCYVRNGKLSSCLYQRSADMCLGVPYNIASYSLLTFIICKLCDLQPHEFTHCIGDAHVYLTHVENAKLQATRKPFVFPHIKMKKIEDIDSISEKDFELCNYKCHKFIKYSLH